MKSRRFVTAAVLSLALICLAGFARLDKPYHDGSVWDISFIRVKPGMDEAYMKYLSGQWKQQQEAMKQAGIILSYKVIGTESHDPSDWNLMLMTEFKDMASMEASQDKADELMERLVGDDQKQMQGYRERSEIREMVGSRLAREVLLEPKTK